MARFRDGKESMNWNVMSENDVKNLLHEHDKFLENVYTIDDIKKIFEPYNSKIYNIEILLQDVNFRSASSYRQLNELMGQTYLFLNSKFVRFLNFFGCWFIYGSNGRIYRNLPENEHYGKAPLLTRIRRWFKKRFTKPVQENSRPTMTVCTAFYEEAYADAINEITYDQWGDLGVKDIRTEIKKDTICVIAKVEDEVVGFGYGQTTPYTFHIEAIIVKNGYRNLGIGSMIMRNLLTQVKSNTTKQRVTLDAISTNGNINIAGVLKKYQFREVSRDRGFWGRETPDAWCPECMAKPCQCDKVSYELILSNSK